MNLSAERLLAAVMLTILLGFVVGCGGSDAPLDSNVPEQATGPEVAQVGPDGMVRVIVSLQSRAGNADRTMVANAGGRTRHVFQHINGMSADVPEQAIEALRRNPRVTAVERAGIMRTSEVELVLPWGVDRIDDRVPPAPLPEGSNRGEGVFVAIIDTGIDYNHDDLESNYSDVGNDFVNHDDDPMDDNGHGTHCAGIVAANKPTATAYGVVGVAPLAHVCAYKVLGSDGSGTTDNLVAAIDRAMTDDVDVASISMGSDVGNAALEDICNVAEQSGIVLVAAAGNSGHRNTRFDTVQYPAKYNSVIAVGATAQVTDERPTWSSTGPSLELAAPGSYIFSTYLTNAGAPTGYATMSGTSMACPHVSGAAALAIASGLTGAATRALLVSTADDLGPAGWDVEYGNGMVDADEAAGDGAPPPNSAPVANDDSWETSVDTTLTVDAPGVLGNDSDPDGDPIVALQVSPPTGGSLALNANGSFQYTPNSGFEGVDSFTYLARDTANSLDSAPATVTITVGSSSGGALVIVVDTDQDSYTTGDTAYITVNVTDGASPVSGASVSMRLTTPKGKVYTQSGTTNSSGDASFSHGIHTRRDGSGVYTVSATASAAGYEEGTGSSTFEAN